jgi:osmotically inducible protein OsmC
MKFTRKASVDWKSRGTAGQGNLTTGSNVLEKIQYSLQTRFADGKKETNSEKLIGAAYADCFAMQLNEENFIATSLELSATVTFEDGAIKKITLNLFGDVPDIDI